MFFIGLGPQRELSFDDSGNDYFNSFFFKSTCNDIFFQSVGIGVNDILVFTYKSYLLRHLTGKRD